MSVEIPERAMNRGVRHPERLGRYRNYEPPPAGFDPHTASNAVLLRHGLPRRPDPEREPDLARIWKRLFARPLTHLKAELKVAKGMSDHKPVVPNAPDFANFNWAGAIILSNEPFYKWVFAEWEIPEVTGDKHFWEPDRTIGFWVGLDGTMYYGDGFQVLQAGVSATLTTRWSWGWPHSVIEWSVWTEWWHPNDKGAVSVANFPVEPGQRVSFVVCAPQPGAPRPHGGVELVDPALVFIANTSTGHGTSVCVDPPAGITSRGHSVEWIVENPGNGKLLQFNPVAFNDCRAGPNGIVNLTETDARNIMVDVDSENETGRPLTSVRIAPPDSVTVSWISSD